MNYKEIIKALEIFSKYEHDHTFAADHDEIYAGPSPDDVSEEDKIALDKLCWFPDECNSGWKRFI